MAFPDYTVDLYEDCEDALGAGWTETDLSSILSVPDADAEYRGTYGMDVDFTVAAVAHIRYDIGSNKTAVSAGFWYRSPTQTTAFGGGPAIISFSSGTDPSGSYACYLMDQRNAGTDVRQFRIRGTTIVNGPTIVSSTWYWVTISAKTNDTCTLRVYDTSNNQVGVDATCTGNNVNIRYLSWGHLLTGAMTSAAYFDELVADWTDATYPLLGWETSAGGLSIPVAMRILNGGVKFASGAEYMRW